MTGARKKDGHSRALLRAGKALFVVGHEAKQSARLWTLAKRTDAHVPYCCFFHNLIFSFGPLGLGVKSLAFIISYPQNKSG